MEADTKGRGAGRSKTKSDPSHFLSQKPASQFRLERWKWNLSHFRCPVCLNFLCLDFFYRKSPDSIHVQNYLGIVIHVLLLPASLPRVAPHVALGHPRDYYEARPSCKTCVSLESTRSASYLCQVAARSRSLWTGSASSATPSDSALVGPRRYRNNDHLRTGLG